MVKLIERKVEQVGEKYNVTSVVEMDKREIQDQLTEFENQADTLKAGKHKIEEEYKKYNNMSAEEVKKRILESIQKQIENFNNSLLDIEPEVNRIKEKLNTKATQTTSNSSERSELSECAKNEG